MQDYDPKYHKEYLAGYNAFPGTKCPYSEIEIGKRCSWLGGHFDKNGVQAWSKAKCL